MKVLIKNIDKAMVLMALYNASKMQGASFIGGNGSPMDKEQADKLIKDNTDFDYLNGKVMKINLGGDILELWLYDRDNGEGAGLRAIQGVYPDVVEMTQADMDKLQAEGRTKRDETKTTTIELAKVEPKSLEEELALIDGMGFGVVKTLREKKLVIRNHANSDYYKKTGQFLPTEKKKKHKQGAKIEYHKGFFLVNGEKRTKIKKRK